MLIAAFARRMLAAGYLPGWAAVSIDKNRMEMLSRLAASTASASVRARVPSQKLSYQKAFKEITSHQKAFKERTCKGVPGVAPSAPDICDA